MRLWLLHNHTRESPALSSQFTGLEALNYLKLKVTVGDSACCQPFGANRSWQSVRTQNGFKSCRTARLGDLDRSCLKNLKDIIGITTNHMARCSVARQRCTIRSCSSEREALMCHLGPSEVFQAGRIYERLYHAEHRRRRRAQEATC